MKSACAREDLVRHPRTANRLEQLFLRLESPRAAIKYGAAKRLCAISEREPARLYPDFQRFASMLDNPNKILQWNAMFIIGNLATVDVGHKIEAILERFLQPISGSAMISAANTIKAAGHIAQAQPGLAQRVMDALLKVESATYQTPECRNVALGHAVSALELFFEQLPESETALAFVRRQLANPRPAVRKKAVAFLKHHPAGLQA